MLAKMSKSTLTPSGLVRRSPATRNFMVLAVACAPLLLAACGGSDGPAREPLELTLLHVNDHHSRLGAESTNLQVLTAGGSRESVSFPLGGAARVVQAIDELAAARPNVVKLHAGDAITGDLYYTITNGQADAALMNAVCYDAFALGNHEFDSGDVGLGVFLDYLYTPLCRTPVLSANLRPTVGASAIAPRGANDYVQPSTVLTRSGQRIGIVGITVAGKTKNSSRPDAGTTFADEVSSAQAAIDALRNDGIDKIVLLTHQGYAADQTLARALSGVDVIVGGDSHTLLGPAALSSYGLTPAGDYPTRSTDRDGQPVCIVQAWQYNYAVGELRVRFGADGVVERCEGQPHVLVGSPTRRVANNAPALSDADRAAIAADLSRQPALRTTTESARALALLAPFASQRTAFAATRAGSAGESLCLRRVPGNKRDISRSTLGDACNRNPFNDAHGGDTQQLVAQAFLEQGRSFGGVDIALQNAGGVRIDIPQGDLTVGTVYTLLPFRNTLVRMTMTGAEVKQTLEDAIAFVLASAGNSGAYPYAAHLRWIVNLNAPANNRFSNLEFKNAAGAWVPLDPAASYRVITNDFLAAGQDGWVTLRSITGSRREDTFLDYADSFLRYVQGRSSVVRLAVGDYSTQAFVDTP
jgi:5'-nucleotidase / UDP-sugar diphosphatase